MTEDEKRITALQGEIARLKAAEPSFRVDLLNQGGEVAEKLELDMVRYVPLTEDEVSQLMTRIRTKFPLLSDFGSRETSRRKGGSLPFPIPEEFVPATEKEIAAYRGEKYPNWLTQCERKLRSFDSILQQHEGVPSFTFVAVNGGTRPGKDVVVKLKAQGAFTIKPPPYRQKPTKQETEPLALPAPPSVPHGSWRAAGVWGQYHDMLRGLGHFPNLATAQIVPPRLGIESLNVPKHDSNAFYYKPTRPSSPTSEFELECRQWRHGKEPVSFSGEIHIDKEEGAVSGALECWIHAENLSDPIVKRVPVRIGVRRISAYDAAENRVEFLLAGLSL